jgi:SAM-dependent methyltransferase
VISNFALHHLSHDDKKVCAQEVWRVLKPGGVFVYGDQHANVMGEVDDPERVLHTLELLTNKARYYFLHAGMERMLLQLRLLPRFINQDGEILATPKFWLDAIEAAGFVDLNLEVIEPAELMNRVISARRPLSQ